MVRVRIAPSPTGAMHFGLARTALYNWLFAKKNQGKFILRIDDTDVKRNRDELLTPILTGLRWLGLEWDEGPVKGGPYEPYYQSQRGEIYQKAVEKLIEKGAAYYDYAKPEEIAQERESARLRGETFLYSRRWMAETAEDRLRFEKEGRSPVVRLKMPREGKLVLFDLIRGKIEFNWALEQDHIIQRADGSFLYHLTSAVDDGEMRISHIIRAEEHLSNTPRQVFILEALGYQLPQFAHLPYVAAPGSKNKLSKRRLGEYLKKQDFAELVKRGEKIVSKLGLKLPPELFNPVVVDFYRQVGFLPEAVVNYLALLGWSLDDKTEFFNYEELIRSFSLERVVHSPASFDPHRLMSFQVHYMMALPVEKRVALCLPYLVSAGIVSEPVSNEVYAKVTAVVTAAGDRIKVAGDILDYEYFFVPDEKLTIDQKVFAQFLGQESQKNLLKEIAKVLSQVEEFTNEKIKTTLANFAREHKVKEMVVSQTLRVAITGVDFGFGIDECLTILGKKRTLNRIDKVLKEN